jgi:hypothetical protein
MPQHSSQAVVVHTMKNAEGFVAKFADGEKKAGRAPPSKALKQPPGRLAFAAVVNTFAMPFTVPRMSL